MPDEIIPATAPISKQAKTYFIEAPRAGGGPIKIGKAFSIKKRLSLLQCGCPDELRCIGYLEGDREREMHKLFAWCRIRPGGEWFWADEIGRYVRANCIWPYGYDKENCFRGFYEGD